MTGPTRIKGVALTLEIGTPPIDYKCDITAAKITNEESDADTTTFCDVAEGDQYDYFLNLTAVQSTDVESLWSHIWEHSGAEVAFTYAPHGNATPTPNQPHFIGTVKIGPRPEIGGEAGKDNTFVYETVWKITGKPVLDRGEPED